MAPDLAPAKPLICPSCFAREIDPVFLCFDEEESEFYCQHCGYTSASAEEVECFLATFIHCRHGIKVAATGE